MKRLSRVAALLIGAWLALAAGARPAAARDISLGAYGGASIPVAQDDNGRGSLFGARLGVHVIPLLAFEPYYQSTSGGSKDQEIGGTTYTRDGVDVKAYGLNALLSFGGPFSIYPFAGIGKHKVTRDGDPDRTLTGFNGGLGIGISPMPGLRVDVRGEANAIRQDGFGRTTVNVTAGLSYRIFHMP